MAETKKNVNRPSARLAPLALVLAMLPVSPGHATPDQEKLKLDFGDFKIYGRVSQKFCTAQANLRSRQGRNAVFSIYWKIGRSIYLLVKHPGNAAVKGRQNIRFVFGSGKTVTFPMRPHGDVLQVTIGFGARGTAFYDAVQANRTLKIDMPALNDSVKISLKKKHDVESAMQYCYRWVKS